MAETQDPVGETGALDASSSRLSLDSLDSFDSIDSLDERDSFDARDSIDSMAPESRRSMPTLAGPEKPGSVEDSLFGEDEDEARGPEWCVECGDGLKAMNKFELWLALGSGDFSPNTRVWKVGRERWQPASEVPDLACALRVHAQTLMAAARVAAQAENDTHVTTELGMDASTPSFTATAESEKPAPIVEGDRSSLDGTSVDEKTIPLYLVRNSARHTAGRRMMIAGLFGSGSVVPPVPPKVIVPAWHARVRKNAASFAGAAAAAIALCFVSGNASTAPRAAMQPATAEAAGAFALGTPEVIEPLGQQSLAGASIPEVAASVSSTQASASLPAAEERPAPSASASSKKKKSVSPTHKGQERARKRPR